MERTEKREKLLMQYDIMEYPKKTGICDIRGCCRKPTDWHHVISQNQIQKRGLPKSMLTDPGNLKEYCRNHHMMTTSFMVRKRLDKKEGKKWNQLALEIY